MFRYLPRYGDEQEPKTSAEQNVDVTFKWSGTGSTKDVTVKCVVTLSDGRCDTLAKTVKVVKRVTRSLTAWKHSGVTSHNLPGQLSTGANILQTDNDSTQSQDGACCVTFASGEVGTPSQNPDRWLEIDSEDEYTEIYTMLDTNGTAGVQFYITQKLMGTELGSTVGSNVIISHDGWEGTLAHEYGHVLGISGNPHPHASSTNYLMRPTTGGDYVTQSESDTFEGTAQ